MRILFAGSPEIALPALERMAAEHTVVGILTNPDAPKGRGLCHACTPVAELAGRLLPGVPVLSPSKLDADLRSRVSDLQADLLAVFAYGTIFGPKFLALFPKGAINVHPSLLPRWRGCSPIQHAILHRDSHTGVSVQRVALKMDTGDILARQELPLDGSETAGSLSNRAADVGAELLSTVVSAIAAGTERAEPQDESAATYCSMLDKDSARLEWSYPALDISARVRAFNPWPLAWSVLNGQRVSIYQCLALPDEPDSGQAPGTVLRVDKSRGIMVQTGQGCVALQSLQLAGKKNLPFKDFANGVRNLVSSRFDLE